MAPRWHSNCVHAFFTGLMNQWMPPAATLFALLLRLVHCRACCCSPFTAQTSCVAAPHVKSGAPLTAAAAVYAYTLHPTRTRAHPGAASGPPPAGAA